MDHIYKHNKELKVCQVASVSIVCYIYNDSDFCSWSSVRKAVKLMKQYLHCNFNTAFNVVSKIIFA